jgi:hypothetical protein
MPPSSISLPAIRAATDALLSLQKPSGWSYNRHTAADADSTAWACRVLAALGYGKGLPLAGKLLPFIHADGSSSTFLGEERFGSWAGYHPDVQPMIGNAIVRIYAADPDPALAVWIRRLREACILSAGPDGWASFWWTTDAYAIATSLEFLQGSGGIPPAILDSVTRWLAGAGAPRSSFEAAQYLMIALLTGNMEEQYLSLLIDTQLDDGSWPSSSVLLVPAQFNNGEKGQGPAFPDLRRIMSTAMALIAMKTLLLATRRLLN